MRLDHREADVARWSLVAVWLWTAFVSVEQWHGMSRALLAAQPALPAHWHGPIILSGAAVDLLIGLWMAWRPGRWAFACAASMTLAMTAAGTVIDPTLWLQPLGPLSKNLPIFVLLWLLMRRGTDRGLSS